MALTIQIVKVVKPLLGKSNYLSQELRITGKCQRGCYFPVQISNCNILLVHAP